MTSNQHRQSEPNQDAEPYTDEWVGNDPDYVKCEDCQAWANVDDVQDRYNHDPDCPKFRDCACLSVLEQSCRSCLVRSGKRWLANRKDDACYPSG